MRDAVLEAKERERIAEIDAAHRARPKRGPHLEIEGLTRDFRMQLARAHRDVARDAKKLYRDAVTQWGKEIDGETPDIVNVQTCRAIAQAATNRAKWHDERAAGQIERFDRVRSCGTRIVHAQCLFCREETRPVPEGCGVRRICDRCDVEGAMKRRARFGRSRGRVVVEGVRYGLTRAKRVGGRYTEKMLTLTVPHVTLADCTRPGTKGPHVLDVARDDTHARIAALFLAWPRFLKKMNRHWAARWEDHVSHHRAFEWTPGGDGIGHPHFHVYFWSPWIDVKILRAWWAEALREVGVPVRQTKEGSPVVSVDLRMLRGFNVHAIRELLKGGRRQALTLSRIDFADGAASTARESRLRSGPGIDAFKYAEGWTIGDIVDFCSADVVARLYCALEGRRLTQASRAFYTEDPPPECPCCGSGQFRIWFVNPHVQSANDAVCTYSERGPPS